MRIIEDERLHIKCRTLKLWVPFLSVSFDQYRGYDLRKTATTIHYALSNTYHRTSMVQL